MANDPSAKAASFLAALRAGSKPSRLPGSAPAEDNAAPLARRLEELDKRVLEIAKTVAPPQEGEPPRPPTDLMMYVHARTELLERKLQEAQAEALRANLLLHEREAAQRKAQKEVEDLFRNIREQTRAAAFDGALREQVSLASAKIQELEARVSEMGLKSMQPEEAKEALEARERAEGLAEEIQAPARRGARAPEPERPPAPAAPPEPGMDSATALLLTARIADLERQLHEAREEAAQERARRAQWEREVVASFAQANERWKRSAGVGVTVEAALETMALSLREREEVENELQGALELSQAQPPGSPADPVLRARITLAQERLAALGLQMDQQFNLVQAWLERNK